ncbi:PREDICTED: cytochrome b-c1 complex subunit 7-like [Vollenhovia emeryi]|uniref:cytochrome b-c1 complex subunit 7-like n=1 Tax=Vollenhovia emeryi TaxID=411798 RepID=UPI0005F4B30A|nr:PREDICTED: cytochrome b-c1 complex subunit 7-like [Vollenhovia emeryi]
MSKQMNQLISIGFRKWCYNLSGFNQYGLWRDDLLREDADVTEALRRVPQEIVDRRNFRIVRAMQLSACHRILPKEEWTKFDEDVRYLQPYVDDVIKEREERERWEAS